MLHEWRPCMTSLSLYRLHTQQKLLFVIFYTLKVLLFLQGGSRKVGLSAFKAKFGLKFIVLFKYSQQKTGYYQSKNIIFKL